MEISYKSVQIRVFMIITEHYGINVDQFNMDSELYDLGDDLDFIELIMALEENFEIEISDDDTKAISTVKNAVDYVYLATSLE